MVEAAVSVIIPTYNAGKYLEAQLDVLTRQALPSAEILIVDSSSTDNTVKIAERYGAHIHIIPKAQFDHGGTRTQIGKLAKGDILVYLTQDSLPMNELSVANLVSKLLEDDRISAAFGRQIPHPDATPFAQHLRLFNYPAQSYVRTIRDREQYGIKTFFCSNSFAAYRRKALESVGWFKAGLLVGEDMHACAKMLANGCHVAYVADAVVFHSHNYPVRQEFKRYFDLGVLFSKEQWLREKFGNANSEGVRFVRSELTFLLKRGLGVYIPASLLRTIAKWGGYRLGHWHRYMPDRIIQSLSMHWK
jgi:rhamnosyltransferase